MKCYIKDYPRPQFVRNNWENLNGTWDFCFDDQNIGETDEWYHNFETQMTIQVPFTYETKLSGIQDESRHDNIWYHRIININKKLLRENDYILHFEGSDFITKVWVNGQYVGNHRGGYSRFSFDITKLLKDGENHLTVKVEDSFDMQQPRGKQRWLDENYLCWYVQTTGIWKTVWSEYVPKISLDKVKMTPNIEDFSLEIEYDIIAPENRLNGELMIETTITFEDQLVSKTLTAFPDSHVCSKADMKLKLPTNYINDAPIWSPATPNLYDIQFRLLDNGTVLDEVGSYAAMRQIRIDGSNILLNNKILYQKLILDQGYWKDSHLTPPDEEALIEDIDKIHALGYNGLRKHQKTEDERFLYWCDVKGMLVWCEAPSSYRYSDYSAEEFTKEWLEIVKQNYNHPCVITWTALNESWGINKVHTNVKQQHFTEAVYHLTKMFDPYRPVLVNDGWVNTISDILTFHDYDPSGERFHKRYIGRKEEFTSNEHYFNCSSPAFACGYEYKGQPIIISEFGGIAFDNDDSGWGYGGKENTVEDFLKRFDGLVSAIKGLPYVCGYCYTQVTDVQQEINGLMDIDRNFKIEPELIKEINQRKVNPLYK